MIIYHFLSQSSRALRIVFVSSLIFFMVFPSAFAEENGVFKVNTISHYLKGTSFNLGISFKQLSLDVYDRGSTNPLGILSGNFITTYSFGINSPSKYLIDSNVGYMILMNYSGLEMKTQEIDSEDLDLGTSLRGFYAYLNPVLFYSFGDKIAHEDKHHSFKIGFGLGVGYLKAKGDIIFTEKNAQERHAFDLNEYTIAYALLFDYQYNRFFSRITAAGPEVTKGPFEYNIFDIAIEMGARVDL